MAFKDNLFYFRTKANLSQAELAQKCGIAQQTVFSYEIGTKTPRIEILVALAKALNCTTDELLLESR
ncbi:MAG: helix-turn-helix domain-containing protein [Huintestinicola sp.]